MGAPQKRGLRRARLYNLEPVFITGEWRIAGGFCRSARKKTVGILCVCQDF